LGYPQSTAPDNIQYVCSTWAKDESTSTTTAHSVSVLSGWPS